MPLKKDTTLVALKGYEPPAPPEPVPDLKAADVTKVKDRVKTLLAAGPLEMWDLVHHVKHHARVTDGIAKVTTQQVRTAIEEMASGGEFEAGYGDKPAVVAEPEPVPE